MLGLVTADVGFSYASGTRSVACRVLPICASLEPEAACSSES
jgi:hypothetical protein